MKEIYKLEASEIARLIKDKKISAKEVLGEFYKRVSETEGKIHSFITLTEELAKKQAEEIDEKISKGNPVGLLAGVPVAIKDNICIKGVKTTCGSKILENFIAPYNATVIEKLKEADAIFIGKTNMDEFAMGSSCETSYFGPTKNPHNTETIPGGSSGGSATAVSSFEVPISLGSDTGGSIRQPASCCGVVGFKPTYGRVSRYGLVAFASSLDQIGPFANSVSDIALVLNVISGYDKRDPTSVNLSVPDYTELLSPDIKNIKIGIPKEYFIKGIDGEVEKTVKSAIEKFKDFGCELLDISLPHTEYAVSVYYIIAPSEASANLARYDGVKYGYRTKEFKDDDLIKVYEKTRGEGFGSEVKRRIMLGTYALSSGYYDAYYLKAQKVRTLIKNDFDEAFKKVDVIITPTAPTTAFKLGEKIDDPLQMYLSDIFTIPCNLAGLPAVSIPCGFSKNGLPVGLQILGKPYDEEMLICLASAYEKNVGWKK